MGYGRYFEEFTIGETIKHWPGRTITEADNTWFALLTMNQHPLHSDAHYAEHVEQPWYPPLRAFVTSGPMVALVLQGDQAVEVVRGINGATDGRKAAPGTIRGDLSLSNRENLVHGSDSPESAAREIALWFPYLAD